jgi:acetyl esterase/lipase
VSDQPDLLPDAVLRYADHDDGLIDVHLPRATTTDDSVRRDTQLAVPEGATRREGVGAAAGVVVLLVHGGFWKTAWDRRHTRAMARALAGEGFVVATPEYRRVGPGGSGGWPETGEDVRRAADRLPELLDGIGVPMEELRVTGHSAGGQLALWLAATGLPVERTVALAPVGDLRAAIDRRLGDDAVLRLLGNHDLEESLAAADPMSLLDARPAGDVHIVHGARDDIVPVELSRGLVERHPWVRLHETPGAHFEVIEPGSSDWAEVLLTLCGHRDDVRQDGDGGGRR